MRLRKYQYSIEVARRIYSSINNDEDAWKILVQNVSDFLKSENIKYEFRECSGDSIQIFKYVNSSAEIELIKMGNSYSLKTTTGNSTTDSLIEEVYNRNELFGLPVFSILMVEGLSMSGSYTVFIDFMSHDSFVSLDTPEAESIRKIFG